MKTQNINLSSDLPALDDELKQSLVKWCDKTIKMSQDKRDELGITENIDKVMKADRKEHPARIKELDEWRSKSYLPWIKDAHEAIYSFTSEMMIGRNNDFYSIEHEYKDEVVPMEKVIDNLFRQNFDLVEVLKQVEQQRVKKGNTVLKCYWQKITRDVPVTRLNDLGNVVREKITKTEYNDPVFEYVEFEDFHFWPVCGSFNKSTRVHRKMDTFSNLIDNKDQYNNIDELLEKYAYEDIDDIKQKEVEIFEMHIFKVNLDGKEVNNAIVTIADGNVVIDFIESPYDYGVNCFFFAPYKAIEGTNLGEGACFNAIDIQKDANFIWNAIQDSEKIGLYPMWLVPFGMNLSNFVARPGGMITWQQEFFQQGIRPEPFPVDVSRLPLGFETLLMLKKEFEKTTIPEFIQGMRPENDETATRDSLVKQGADTKLNAVAMNYNSNILQPLITLLYILYSQMILVDEELRLKVAKIVVDRTREEVVKVASHRLPQVLIQFFSIPQVVALTQMLGFQDALINSMTEDETVQVMKTDEELLEELEGMLPPIEEVNISVHGFTSNSMKVMKLQKLKSLSDAIAQLPEIAQKLDQEYLIREALHSLDIDTSKAIMSDEKAMKRRLEDIREQGELEKEKMQIQMEMQMMQQQMIPEQGVTENV